MLSETVKEIFKDAERYHRKVWLMMTVSSMLWLLLGYLTINHSGNLIPRNVNTSFIYLLYVVALVLVCYLSDCDITFYQIEELKFVLQKNRI